MVDYPPQWSTKYERNLPTRNSCGKPSEQAHMSFALKPPPSYNAAPSSDNITPPPSYPASVQQKPSLDLSQRFEKKLAEYNASQNILKRWLFEIISLTISAICMVRITLNRKRLIVYDRATLTIWS